MTLELRLLGPLEVALDGRPLGIAGRKRRSLLALLALHAGEPVARARLIEELWPGHDPKAPARLQVYVSQLRRAVGAAALELRADGYLLAAQTDAALFEGLAAEGRAALRAGDARAAAETLGDALALWRGPALGELAYEPFAQAAADQLEELRCAALEDRIDADLELGRAQDVVAEIEALVGEHPLRERLWRALMLALYRCGRQADALAAFSRARTVLVEELGLEPGPELRALQEAILRHDPALLVEPEELRARRHLPAPPTALVGRREEIDEVVALLSAPGVRLVTLTGPGGTGKTRLAIQSAAELADRFDDGVFFVALAPLAEAALVPDAIAEALGVPERAAEPRLETLERHLRDRRALIVLDNFEHVDDAAPVVSCLLERAPDLSIVVTSRAALRLYGEHEHPVPTLPEVEAAELFVARARAARRGFDAEDAVVAELCARVDRLPLAIELVAGRSRMLSPREMLAGLGQRLELAADGPRDAPARHRALRATLDWSDRLLREHEREQFARVAVFAGGFTEAAAAEVCGADPAVLAALAEQSLLVRRPPRLDMLETVREYALERLEERGEGEVQRARHAEHCVALVEAGQPEVTTSWLDRLEEEHPNLRAALAWSRRAGAVEVELRLVARLARFWGVRGHLREGQRRVADTLADPAGQPPALRAKVLAGDATLALRAGDYARLRKAADEAREICERLGDREGEARALDNLATAAANLGDVAGSLALYERSGAIFRELRDDRGVALSAANIGCLALMTGDHERAAELSLQAVELQRRLGQLHLVHQPLFNLGLAAVMLGRFDEALAHFHEGMDIARDLGSDEALIYILQGVAAIDVAQGRPERAARLLGAAGAAAHAIGVVLEPLELEVQERTVADAVRALGEDSFAAAHAEGARLELDDVIAETATR